MALSSPSHEGAIRSERREGRDINESWHHRGRKSHKGRKRRAQRFQQQHPSFLSLAFCSDHSTNHTRPNGSASIRPSQLVAGAQSNCSQNVLCNTKRRRRAAPHFSPRFRRQCDATPTTPLLPKKIELVKKKQLRSRVGVRVTFVTFLVLCRK